MASPGVTVAGTFVDNLNNAIVGLQVGFKLQATDPSYQGPWQITGTGTLPNPPSVIYGVTNSSGVVSVTIWGNDQFVKPTSSFYAVQAGNFAFDYQFLNGNSYDLLTATPINPVAAGPTPAGAQNANLVLAGPTSGGAAIPTFRGLVVGDLPVSGTWPFSGAISGAITLTGVTTFNNAPSSSGTQAVLSGTGACATLSTQKGGAWTGSVICTGSTGASTLVIAPPSNAPNGFTCYASDLTTNNALRQSATGSTNCTISGTVNANDVLTFLAVGY